MKSLFYVVALCALAAQVEAFYEGAYGEPVAVYLQPTYTFEWDVAEGGSGVLPAFVSYGAAYEAAVTEQGEDLSFAGIIAADIGTTQVFAFENAAGEKVALGPDRQGQIRVADVEEHAAAMREMVRKKYELFKEYDVGAERNRALWEEIVEEFEEQGLVSP